VAALRTEDGSGHVVVVVGAHYQEVPATPEKVAAGSPRTEYRFMAINIWDPAKDPPGSPVVFGGEHWLAASEFASHCDFMASRNEAVEYIKFLEERNLQIQQALVAEKANRRQ
jgi:hypothetical protein